MKQTLDQLCIDTIRTLSMDAVQAANSGHPGTAMALAPVAHILYDKLMRFNPQNPGWINRDRFILSVGHASMLLYSALHINGFDVSLDDIRSFRQLHSKCAGHPEYGHTPGVETTTGPLGQGLATSVGFAIAEKWLAEKFNRPGFELINYHVFSLAGDGCMMEGISSEAASLAGHLGLGNLVWIYDSNQITIEGSTNLAFTEDVGKRFHSYNWQVLKVADVNELGQLQDALSRAKSVNDKPTLIIVNSHIAYGAPTKQDTHGAHGSPLGEEEIKGAKSFYGWDPEKKFSVPEPVNARIIEMKERGKKAEAAWEKQFAAYRAAYPADAAVLDLIIQQKLPVGWEKELPAFEAGTQVSGRKASAIVLNTLASKIPIMMGGSADLAPSTLTDIKHESSFQRAQFIGRNLHYGIREHAMGAIMNGLSLSGLLTYGSTFLVFSDYTRSSIRLSALMKLPVTYIFTHDSIGVGEDGPTHQPIEHLASLRAMPGLELIRPADANEVAVMWHYIMKNRSTPTALILSRQDLPVFDRTKYAPATGGLKGGYVMADSTENPEVLLMATGSEVQLAIAAFEQLKAEGIPARVISLPNWQLFDRQPAEYRESVMPLKIRARIGIEAASPFGWGQYLGLEGKMIGMRTFGASGTLPDLLDVFGLTVEAVVAAAKTMIGK
ncbi:MAG: transketolase [Bacteroidales bacterium]|nr:transketolase [Bacteroidales bacterium]